MGRFDGIDLSVEGSLRRMIRSVVRNRVEILRETAQFLEDNNMPLAAQALRDKAEEELREVGI